MAKVSFNKLNLKNNNEIVPINIGNVTIGVKQYLPVEEKFKLIASVLSDSYDVENNFANPLKQEVCFYIALIDYYTDINFTDKQREDIQDLYDKLVGNNVMHAIINAIPPVEFNRLIGALNTTCEAFYKYRTSALGILDVIKTDYDDLDLNAQKIKDKFSDPETAATIKELMSKLS